MIENNIARIRDGISLICQGLRKNPSQIKLICVTKSASPEMIYAALQSGITDIGENRVQDAEKKFIAVKQLIKGSLNNFLVKYHMVGHLQTNKVKLALTLFDLIQSVDSLRLAREIDRELEKLNKTADILLQVNTSQEASKFGVNPDKTIDLIAEISKFKRIRIKGLMTIASESEDAGEIRGCFRELRMLKEKISQEFNLPNVQMQYISMGMTNDYGIALEEGSNMLRIGRAIFHE